MKKSFKAVAGLAVSGAVLAGAVAGLAAVVTNSHTSEGDRTGTVTQLAVGQFCTTKPFVCRTVWTGELKTSANDVFKFSTSDAATADALTDARQGGYLVDLHYTEKNLDLPVIGYTSDFVTKVTPAV